MYLFFFFFDTIIHFSIFFFFGGKGAAAPDLHGNSLNFGTRIVKRFSFTAVAIYRKQTGTTAYSGRSDELISVTETKKKVRGEREVIRP